MTKEQRSGALWLGVLVAGGLGIWALMRPKPTQYLLGWNQQLGALGRGALRHGRLAATRPLYSARVA